MSLEDVLWELHTKPARQPAVCDECDTPVTVDRLCARCRRYEDRHRAMQRRACHRVLAKRAIHAVDAATYAGYCGA